MESVGENWTPGIRETTEYSMHIFSHVRSERIRGTRKKVVFQCPGFLRTVEAVLGLWA